MISFLHYSGKKYHGFTDYNTFRGLANAWVSVTCKLYQEIFVDN